MAWTTFGTDVFGANTLLTSLQMQQLRDNVEWLAAHMGGGANLQRNMNCRIDALGVSSSYIRYNGNFRSFSYLGIGNYSLQFSDSFVDAFGYSAIATIENSNSNGDYNYAMAPPYSAIIYNRSTAGFCILLYSSQESGGHNVPVRMDWPVNVHVISSPLTAV